MNTIEIFKSQLSTNTDIIYSALQRGRYKSYDKQPRSTETFVRGSWN